VCQDIQKGQLSSGKAIISNEFHLLCVPRTTPASSTYVTNAITAQIPHKTVISRILVTSVPSLSCHTSIITGSTPTILISERKAVYKSISSYDIADLTAVATPVSDTV